ncbi:PEP-CTERM sorting domain-containing protein [Janthinobacterium sp. MDB2-8]|uniref:PEP-CTERM sorting domain-containing protein n=1 Tax=Janthinobacterium sp. MDB2-8 TaxID=1259338 RepID=UPI003F23AC1F
MKKIIALLFLLTSQITTAQATAVIEDVSYTAHSITFTATGDLSGYTVPTGPYATDYISIMYTGDISSTDNPSNLLIGNLIAGGGPADVGYTGGYGDRLPNYTWIFFGPDVLPAATFSGTPFRVEWRNAQLNPSGTGQIHFLWGNPSNNATTLIQAFNVNDGTVTPVPEPETYAMLLAGLGLLGFIVRRSKKLV